jgi:hypothetical protein
MNTSQAFLDVADRQISAPRKARLQAAEKRAQTRAEKAQVDKEKQFTLWREWRRERSETLLAGPYADAARDLIELLDHLTVDAADMLLERVRRGPWRDADPETRFTVLALIDSAIIELRERQGLPPFDDPVLPDDPLNVFLILREMLSI